MEIYILKEKFINDACRVDKQFKTKSSRPYMCILVTHLGKNYLMPISHSGNSKYSYQVSTENYIHFDKCFELINRGIIERSYIAKTGLDRKFIITAQKSEKAIYKSFLAYLKIHPTKWSTNTNIISQLQKTQKY